MLRQRNLSRVISVSARRKPTPKKYKNYRNSYTAKDVIEGHKGHLDSVERHLDSVESRLQETTKTVGEVAQVNAVLSSQFERLLNEVREGFARMDAKFDAQGKNLDAKFDAQGKNLDTNIEKLNAKIDAQSEKLDAVEKRVTTGGLFLVIIAILVVVCAPGVTPTLLGQAVNLVKFIYK